MSSVYWPTPVRKRASSRRRTDWPVNACGAFMSSRPRSGHLLRRLDDGAHDVLVAGAAAHVAFEALADLRLARAVVVLHEVDRAHHHARRAEAALQPVALVERDLHRVQRAVG